MLCPMCNEMNKVDARYCEYCGTKLEPTTTGVTANASNVSQSQPMVVSALTCPQCGAVVLLDESFCDNCGHVLKQGTGQSGPIPTHMSAALPVTPAPTSVSGEIRMPDLPANGFGSTTGNMNDIHQGNTGSSVGVRYEINDDAIPETTAQVSDNASVIEGAVVDEPSAVVDEPSAVVDEPSAVVDEPVASSSMAVGEVVDESSASEVDLVVAPITEEPADDVDGSESAPTLPPVMAVVVDAQEIKQKRQTLEDEIKRQKDIIQQLNQMRNAFREVTPQAVLMGIEEAEQKLQESQHALDNLPTLPEIDPQVIERLRKDHTRQLEIIDQFEQLQRTFGLATPRAVIQGIVDARNTEERLRTELQALGVQLVPQPASHEPTPAPEIPVPPPVPTVVPPEPMATVDAAPIAPRNAGPLVPPAAPVIANAVASAEAQLPTVNEVMPSVGQVMNPAAPPARLQLESGTTLQLPAGRREIIIGRSDPISAVHPEIDLTPYGAESGGVSRRHVRLTVIDGQWMITDLQSTNHTRVNGVRIDPGVPTQLPDGAQVVLGRVGFIFRCA
ncbi:MAG: FHA domain-containing protein [Roseiflexaceae bacterium]